MFTVIAQNFLYKKYTTFAIQLNKIYENIVHMRLIAGRERNCVKESLFESNRDRDLNQIVS